MERRSHRRASGWPASAARGASASRVVVAGLVFLNARRSMRSASDVGLPPSPASTSSTHILFASSLPAIRFAHMPMSSCESCLSLTA